MDIRTGRTYETREQALADGVPDADIAEVWDQPGKPPKVKFSKRVFGRFRNVEATDEEAMKK